MSDISDAKRRLLDAFGGAPWLMGVGVGLVGPKREKGLIVSVGADATEVERRQVDALLADAPHELRVVAEIRKRHAE